MNWKELEKRLSREKTTKDKYLEIWEGVAPTLKINSKTGNTVGNPTNKISYKFLVSILEDKKLLRKYSEEIGTEINVLKDMVREKKNQMDRLRRKRQEERMSHIPKRFRGFTNNAISWMIIDEKHRYKEKRKELGRELTQEEIEKYVWEKH